MIKIIVNHLQLLLYSARSFYIDITSFTDTLFKGVGRSEVSAFGGVSPYSYLWDNGQTSSSFNGE